MNPQNSQTTKRKSSTRSSSNLSSTDEHQQRTPPTRVRVLSSSSPNGVYHHSFETSPEFKTTRDHLFKIMPQEPHLQPLEKNSPTALKGFRLVLDIDFVNLALKLSGPVDPGEFSKGIEEYASQLSTFEQNGYNVVKLREKFDKLRKISDEEKRSRENMQEKRDERNDKQVKACITLNRIDTLMRELKTLNDCAMVQKKEIETLDLMEMSYNEERKKILENSSAAASSPW